MNYYNRDLSWLSFNNRVLQEAEDSRVPLIQRLRFLGIYSSNNDEFIQVRLAHTMQLDRDAKTKKVLLPGGYTPRDLIRVIHQDVSAGQKKLTGIYQRILAEMAAEGIYIIDETMLDDEQKQFCRNYFIDVVSRRLLPLFLHKTAQLPFLPDSGIYFAVCLESDKAPKKRFAILQTPVNSSCPRFVKLPSQAGRQDIIFLDDIIRLCLDDIFFMFKYERVHAYMFKLLRDANLSLELGLRKSIVEKMEKGLEERMRGRPVRFVHDMKMPEDLVQAIVSRLKLKPEAIEPGRRYHMMRHLMSFPVIRPDLEVESTPPLPHPDIVPCSSIIRKIDRQDILTSFPYQSFGHVIDFLREAAISPTVESIHITLYRLASDSKIVTALISAARNGKRVIAYVELLARFDEERNVGVIETLQEAGVTVIHGSPELKIHSKLILVQSTPKTSKTGNYVYVGTGNFNEDTAKLYSDFGLLTANPSFVSDARAIFAFLGNMHRRFTCKSFLVSPFTMRKSIKKMIDNEIKNAKKGRPAYIWIKCNNITDEKMAKALYQAGKSGVDVKLIVRSACIIKPQVPELSESIKAISIIDKYLEHARLMFFCNGGEELIYISSADLMMRNLDRRVEVAAPVYDSELQKELKDFFEIQWSDTAKARSLAPSTKNNYIPKQAGDTGVRAQQALYDYYAKRIAKGSQ